MLKVNGSKIRERRLAMGLSLAAAAAKAGMCDRQHWRKVEVGELPMVGVETLYRIAKALRLKMESLLVDTEKEKQPTAPANGAETEGNHDRADVVRAEGVPELRG